MSRENKKNAYLARVWTLLALLRVLLTILGQTGYIHPDEFFQGLEVVSGNVFNCSADIFEAWEFRVSDDQKPLRSILVPYLFYGTPLMMLKALAQTGIISVNGFSLILIPRLFMTLASFLVDFCLLRVCQMLKLDAKSALAVLASSYVSLVYLTHTFSNSIEAILFAVLVYLVVKSIKSCAMATSQPDSLARQRYFIQPVGVAIENKRHPADRNRAGECNTSLGGLIGLVVCLGIFNRPTFVLFSFVPVIYWFLHGFDHCSSIKQIVSWVLQRLAAFFQFILLFTLFAISFDTIYYHKLLRGQGISRLVSSFASGDWPLTTKDLIFTPYNFFIYNSNSSNVNQHGQHPRYQHLLVNCFLLFGLAHLVYLVACLKVLRTLFFDRFQAIFSQPRFSLGSGLVSIFSELVNNVDLFMALSYLFPLAMLSLITHQEPRFLLPLVVPLAMLVGSQITGSRLLKSSWIIFNLACLLVYGYAHQGGLTQTLAHLQKLFVDPSMSNTDVHVIYRGTYMPPRFLLMAPYAQTSRGPAVRAVHDLMSSSSFENLDRLISEIKSNQSTRSQLIYLVTPAFMDVNLPKHGDKCLQTRPDSMFTFELEPQFQVHVSFDHLKMHFDQLACNFGELKDHSREHASAGYIECLAKKCRTLTLLESIRNSFSLNIYRVSP